MTSWSSITVCVRHFANQITVFIIALQTPWSLRLSARLSPWQARTPSIQRYCPWIWLIRRTNHINSKSSQISPKEGKKAMNHVHCINNTLYSHIVGRIGRELHGWKSDWKPTYLTVYRYPEDGCLPPHTDHIPYAFGWNRLVILIHSWIVLVLAKWLFETDDWWDGVAQCMCSGNNDYGRCDCN